MATASAEPSDTECPVCHEEFSSPKILPCAHLLCRHCLITWLESEPNAECPLCRHAIVDHGEMTLKNFEEFAESLPTDLAMETVIECKAVLKKNHVCCGCKTLATATCLTCGDMLCCSCSVIHTSMSMLRDHEVETLSRLTPRRLAIKRKIPCSEHPNSPSEMYCHTHGVAICHICAAVSHRACPDLTELGGEMAKAHELFKGLVATLKAAEGKLEGAIAELDQYLLHVGKVTQATLANIDLNYSRMLSALKAWRTQQKKLTLEANRGTRDRIMAAKNILTHRRGRLTYPRALVERVGDAYSPKCAAGAMSAKIHALTKGLNLQATLSADASPIMIQSLKIDQKDVRQVNHALLDVGVFSETAAAVMAQPCGWQFHTNHGKNIILSNNRQTAERVRGDFDGVVVSALPMASERLYEVYIDEKDAREEKRSLACGVTWLHPDTITLPSSVTAWNSAVVIGREGIYNIKVRTNKRVGDAVTNLRTGSRVGLMVDRSKDLHLYVDGVDFDVVAYKINQPCYAFFHVNTTFKKVTTFSLTVSR